MSSSRFLSFLLAACSGCSAGPEASTAPLPVFSGNADEPVPSAMPPPAIDTDTPGTPNQPALPNAGEPSQSEQPASVPLTNPDSETDSDEADPAAPEAPPTMTEPTPVPVGPEPDLATRALCSGANPISCHFGGEPGNYDVTVVLGGAAAATTVVLTEARRVMLGPITTAAGETRRLTFGVNVRQPEGEPIQAVPAGTPGLDLYFSSVAGSPALTSIGYAPAAQPLMVYVAGDSTVADQTDVAYGGWAQQLPQFFDYPVVVANYADSGESSGSFLNARPLFGSIEARLQPNDWVLIQFGHNDKQVTAAQFHDNLTALVTRVKSKAAFPVLLTPVARAQFNGTSVSPQHINGTGANLPEIVAQVAREQEVPLFDLTARTSQWLAEVGPQGWQGFHALGMDVTHTNDAGAAVEAAFVRDFIADSELDALSSRLR